MGGDPHVSVSAFGVDRIGFYERFSVCRLLDVGVVFCILSDGFLLQIPVATTCFNFARILGGFLSR